MRRSAEREEGSGSGSASASGRARAAPLPHARRCTLAASMARPLQSFWEQLKLLGWRVVSWLIGQRNILPQEADASSAPPAPVAERAARRGVQHAFKYQRLPRSRSRPVPPPPPRQPSPPPLVVKGQVVPKELEAMYMEYKRKSSLVGPTECFCHMCFFEMQRAPRGTVPKKEMLKHCSDKHEDIGMVCRIDDCQVRVSTGRELNLHRHFCH
ncbi:hypothetical protein PVAP13_5KG334000 [Panicum virgatum]|uniref:C2H2-type domain-containing protein n=1 Tax=Panicum virgatum TaxID=38727 RepID=A0A8T0SKC4_PANVG|nr:hypothetical protein PVAP13_5KG334000 [Panicum virgatum]